MCTELLLAIIYFSTIITVNYFLYNLLKNYVKNIFYLLKLKNIFTRFKKEDVKSLALFYFYSKNDFKNINLLGILNKFSSSNDIIVIGKTYDYLATSIEKKSNSSTALIYYLRLLESQYLFMK